MNIQEFFQTLGQYIYIGYSTVTEWLGNLWKAIMDMLPSTAPTSIKLFSNNTANKYLFFGILIYLLLMNIWAFTLFGADKKNAKSKKQRVKESKLMRVCFFGGAVGGLIGMNVFHHKTLKKKFSVGIPILFVIELILYSFILGFIGFWTFF